VAERTGGALTIRAMTPPEASSTVLPDAGAGAGALGSPDVEARQFALLRAFVAREKPRAILSAIVGVGVVALVSLVVDRTRPSGAVTAAAFALAVVAFVVVTYGLATVFRPRRLARGFEVYRWVGRSDWLDWRRRAGRRVPQSRGAARAWLDMELHRQDAAVRDQLPRIEMYVWLGQVDDALRAASALPVDRPWDRFERELMRAFVLFVAGRDAEAEAPLAAARDAAGQLSGDERRLAGAKLATEEARRLAFRAVGDPPGDRADEAWLAPLVEVRDRLGPALDGFLVRDLARWTLPILVVLGALSAAVSFWVAEAI